MPDVVLRGRAEFDLAVDEMIARVEEAARHAMDESAHGIQAGARSRIHNVTGRLGGSIEVYGQTVGAAYEVTVGPRGVVYALRHEHEKPYMAPAVAVGQPASRVLFETKVAAAMRG